MVRLKLWRARIVPRPIVQSAAFNTAARTRFTTRMAQCLSQSSLIKKFQSTKSSRCALVLVREDKIAACQKALIWPVYLAAQLQMRMCITSSSRQFSVHDM